MNLTAPIISGDLVWFSAYGFGWGYGAFSISADAVCGQLGAANRSRKQLLLAFELGKRRLLQAINRKGIPRTGVRTALGAEDLSLAADAPTKAEMLFSDS
jgi:hypothetical protein